MFNAARDVVIVHGGQGGFNKGLYEAMLDELKADAGLGDDDDNVPNAMRQQAIKDSCNESLGCLFVRGADEAR
jgi:hypothetical protein